LPEGRLPTLFHGPYDRHYSGIPDLHEGSLARVQAQYAHAEDPREQARRVDVAKADGLQAGSRHSPCHGLDPVSANVADLAIEVTISRPHDRPAWGRAETELLGYIGPHLGRALRLDRRFRAGTTFQAMLKQTAVRALSPREQDCLAWIARGATSKHAARHLSLSAHTVDEHVRSAMAKLGVTKRTEAATLAVVHGLITI